jgi:hypothetical protein
MVTPSLTRSYGGVDRCRAGPPPVSDRDLPGEVAGELRGRSYRGGIRRLEDGGAVQQDAVLRQDAQRDAEQGQVVEAADLPANVHDGRVAFVERDRDRLRVTERVRLRGSRGQQYCGYQDQGSGQGFPQ